MELSHRFSVPAPIDVAWSVFNQLDLISSCFPGATITETHGDQFAGSVKVKLGPVTLVYDGTGQYVKRSGADQRLVLKARGRDRRGHGDVTTQVTARFRDTGADTEVLVDTVLIMTGKPAQFGTALVRDASEKLIDQFAVCVSDKFAAGLSSGQSPTGTHPPAEQLNGFTRASGEGEGEWDARSAPAPDLLRRCGRVALATAAVIVALLRLVGRARR